MKITVIWNVTPCGSYKNQLFGGKYRLHHQGDYIFLRSVLLLLVITDVPSSRILFSLMMEAELPSEMSVLTRALRRNIPEDGIPLTTILSTFSS
jgi:hypothetical protein